MFQAGRQLEALKVHFPWGQLRPNILVTGSNRHVYRSAWEAVSSVVPLCQKETGMGVHTD